jgi:hypothetical protein
VDVDDDDDVAAATTALHDNIYSGMFVTVSIFRHACITLYVDGNFL